MAASGLHIITSHHITSLMSFIQNGKDLSQLRFFPQSLRKKEKSYGLSLQASGFTKKTSKGVEKDILASTSLLHTSMCKYYMLKYYLRPWKMKNFIISGRLGFFPVVRIKDVLICSESIKISSRISRFYRINNFCIKLKTGSDI